VFSHFAKKEIVPRQALADLLGTAHQHIIGNRVQALKSAYRFFRRPSLERLMTSRSTSE